MGRSVLAVGTVGSSEQLATKVSTRAGRQTVARPWWVTGPWWSCLGIEQWPSHSDFASAWPYLETLWIVTARGVPSPGTPLDILQCAWQNHLDSHLNSQSLAHSSSLCLVLPYEEWGAQGHSEQQATVLQERQISPGYIGEAPLGLLGSGVSRELEGIK